jgi:hypothetical protein
MKIMGIPAKKHFKINGTELINLIQEINQQEVKILYNKKSIHLTTRSQNTLQQEVNSFDNKKSNNLTTIYKEQNINNTYKEQKNNIKKDFDNSLTKKILATQQNVDNEPNIDRSQNAVFIDKNENNVDILYNKTSDPQFINYNTGLPVIILDNQADVVIEKIANFTENDIVDNARMVLDCFVVAGIAVFNDGQQGFGKYVNQSADLWTKSDILDELKNKDIGFRNEIAECCKNNSITYNKLVNYFSNELGKQPITSFRYFFYNNKNHTRWIISQLNKINQLTSNQNDNNNIQGNTNNRGSSQQNEPPTERYFSAGTTTHYGTGAEGLRAIHEAHYK